MDIVIDLTPAEHDRLFAVAKQKGIAPDDLAHQLVAEHLPLLDGKEISAGTDAGNVIQAETTVQNLFAKWAEEDARLTPEEQAENDRIYAEIEKNGIPRVQI